MKPKGALQCGLDALVVQASEGGPGCSTTSLMTLLPAVVDLTSMPVIASGSIVDGRGLAAVMTLGAEAVRCGTRFLSATEADAQSEYERRVGVLKMRFKTSATICLAPSGLIRRRRLPRNALSKNGRLLWFCSGLQRRAPRRTTHPPRAATLQRLPTAWDHSPRRACSPTRMRRRYRHCVPRKSSNA